MRGGCRYARERASSGAPHGQTEHDFLTAFSSALACAAVVCLAVHFFDVPSSGFTSPTVKAVVTPHVRNDPRAGLTASRGRFTLRPGVDYDHGASRAEPLEHSTPQGVRATDAPLSSQSGSGRIEKVRGALIQLTSPSNATFTSCRPNMRDGLTTRLWHTNRSTPLASPN